MKSYVEQFREIRNELVKNESETFKSAVTWTVHWIQTRTTKENWHEVLKEIEDLRRSVETNLLNAVDVARDWNLGIMFTCNYFLGMFDTRKEETEE